MNKKSLILIFVLLISVNVISANQDNKIFDFEENNIFDFPTDKIYLNDIINVKTNNSLDMQTLIFNQSSGLWYNAYLNDSGHSVNNSLLWNGHAYDDEAHWGINGNDAYYNDGNVGIGTASPSQKLDVNGIVALTGSSSFVTDPNAAHIYRQDNNGLVFKGTTGITNNFAFTSASGQIKMAQPSNTPDIIFNPVSGNVGIGTSTPQNKLNVIGNGNFTGTLFAADLNLTSPASINFLDVIDFIQSMKAQTLELNNVTRTGIVTDGDFASIKSINGTLFHAVINLNNGTGAGAGISLINDRGHGLGLFQPSSNIPLLEGNAFFLSTAPKVNLLQTNGSIGFQFTTGQITDPLSTTTGFHNRIEVMNITNESVVNINGTLKLNNNFTTTGNITLGEKIVFGLGEMIDNIVDGWLRITGNLNITGNTSMQGNLDINSNNIVDTARIIFNLTTCNDDEVPGTLCHDEEHGTLKYYTPDGQVIQFSQEVSSPMKNRESFMVMDGSYVYKSGASGDNLEFKLARGDNFNTSGMVGVLTRPCEPNEICAVTFFGFVNGLDTSTYSLDDKRYLSATEAGNATITSPGFPNNIIWMDTVVRVNPQVGRVFVFPRLDTANGMTFNTIGVIGDIIQTNYKIISEEGNDAIGQNVFTIQMNGTTGQDIPHLILQPGGVEQASIWVRSGIVAPEVPNCLNNTNRTDSNCYSNEGGFNWNIDFNTSISNGADWGITGELDVVKNAYIQGDLDVTGNFTGNQIYGEMWNHSDNGFVIDLVTQMVYENITNLDTGLNNGFFHNTTNSILIAQIGGFYKIDYSISFSGSANSEVGFTVGIDGQEQDQTHSHRKIGTGGDVGNTGGTGIIILNEGDAVTLMARDEAAPVQDITIFAININLLRIGN